LGIGASYRPPIKTYLKAAYLKYKKETMELYLIMYNEFAKHSDFGFFHGLIYTKENVIKTRFSILLRR